MKRVHIDNPTPEQERLFGMIEVIDILDRAVSGPIDPEFMPPGLIDDRRRVEIQTRLHDDLVVARAGLMTRLVETGGFKSR